MSDLFWPGDHRAGSLMSDAALLTALVEVENAWLATLVEAGVAPGAAGADLRGLVGPDDLEALAAAAERDGNPVTALVRLLRERADGDTARWLHRGLTSQDVVDSALMCCLRDALGAVGTALGQQIATLVALTERHRDAPILARTLTQPALPSTAGLKFATWLTAVLDASEALAGLPVPPVQVGGAAGTMAAAAELTGSPEGALALSDALADAIGLARALPWHTTRGPLTRFGDALVGCCDAWGRIANDVAAGARTAEFAEGSGGGSSTMPHKSNPVLSVLLRRTAITAPPLAATLHSAAAAGVDERADGGWHAEWATVRTLARHTITAAGQCADLLAGLRFDAARAAANLAAAPGILAEQHSMAELNGCPTSSTYLGATDLLVDAALQRAREHLEGSQ
mgnify:CR=1 FL=1